MTLNELEQQLETIKSEIEKIKKEEMCKKIKPWRANNNGTYYAVSSGGELISLCDDDRTHDKRFEFGNYYRTSSLAVQDAKELALRGKIRQLRDVLCEGFQFGEKEKGYRIYFNTEFAEYCVGYDSKSKNIGVIYFDTQEHAQIACNILNEELGEY